MVTLICNYFNMQPRQVVNSADQKGQGEIS